MMALEISKEGKFALKLLEIEETKKNGILTVEFQKVKKVVCFEDGKICHAVSNIRTEWFLNHLVDSGIIDKSHAVSFMHEPSISEETVHRLINAGLISEEKAAMEARNLIARIVTSCFKIAGMMAFSEGRANLTGKTLTRISPKSLVQDYYRNHASVIEYKLIIGKETRYPQFTPAAEEKLKNADLNEPEKRTLRLIDGTTKLRDILRIFPDPPEETLRNLTVLALLGILELKDKAASAPEAKAHETGAPTETQPAEESDEDVEAKKHYFELYEKHARSNFFQLLGVQRHSSAEEVKNSYYKLAREIHPDHFQKESMSEIRPLIESLFARITEAYNTLSNEQTRKRYEEEIFGEAEQPAADAAEKLDNPTLAKGNFFKGKKLYMQEKYPEALRFLENAVSLDPTRWEHFFFLGMTQAKNPRLRSMAIENLKKAITMNPTLAEAYLEIGILYKKCGKIPEARNMLKSALEWEPNNSIVAFELKELEKNTSGQK
ncbi:MAG: DnaJ domain-containing protein [Acidobacteriota bacterium]